MVVGDFTSSSEVVVVGGGPGGYVAAIRAAQLGQEVILIEKEHLGGVCLNWGCIPSKALIEASGFWHHLENLAELGIFAKQVSLDLQKTHAWKDRIVSKLRQGIETLVQQNGIELLRGTALFASDQQLHVSTREGLRRIEFENLILAPGSCPSTLPDLAIDHENIIDSTDALALQTIPKHLVVIGAGSIGLELGIVFRKFGAQVTILEWFDKLLPKMEPQISRVLQRSLQNLGIHLVLGAKVENIHQVQQAAHIVYQHNGTSQTIVAEKVLMAVGRTPNTDQLSLERTSIKVLPNGFIPVNEKLQTSVPNIFAIGDVVAGPLLAHRASHMGKIAAEICADLPAAFDNLAIPNIIFSDPEIATVGLTEEEARSQGYRVKAGVFPFRALGRALTLNEPEGLTQVNVDAETGIVLGVHIIGPHASDLIAEGTLAVETSAHLDDLTLTIHAHPTLPEGIAEAAEAVENRAIHIFNPSLKKTAGH